MIRCVAFDFDGTLVDSNRIKHDMFYEVLAYHEGASEILTRVLGERPVDRYKVFKRFVDLASPDDSPVEWNAERSRRLADEYSRRCEEAVSSCPECPGATRIVTDLRKLGLITAINSATPTDALRAIVERRGWSNAFAHVLGGPSTKVENLKCLSTIMGLDAKEIVMVGDRAVDQDGALEIGCHFIAFLRPDSDFSTRPELCVSGLEQVPLIIDGLRRRQA
jgi:phosphoglycolate phosphatase-like HAD superfamily hydrolase